MADQKNVAVNNEVAQEATPAAETTKEQVTAPETTGTSAEPAQPEKEKKEHPVWDKVKAGAGKVWSFTKKAAPIAGAVVVGVFAGKALGKAEGYENAMDKMNPSPDPAPALPMNDDIGVDNVVDADFTELDVTPDPVIDTPAE